jgi:hypothetical protein
MKKGVWDFLVGSDFIEESEVRSSVDIVGQLVVDEARLTDGDGMVMVIVDRQVQKDRQGEWGFAV